MSLITPVGRLSYPRLFVPEAYKPGEQAYYQTVIVFDKKAQATPEFKALQEAAVAAAKEKFGKGAAKVLRDAKHPTFRKDGAERGYGEGSVYFRVKTKQPPGVVSVIPDPNNGNKPMVITQEMAEKKGGPFEVYPGVRARLSVAANAYPDNGGGVSFWLNNVQVVGGGDRFAGGVPADQEFEVDEDAAADLADLEGVEVPDTDDEEEDEAVGEDALAALL